jgi:aminoglycoside phosphotransferase (APT) family kinase protein
MKDILQISDNVPRADAIEQIVRTALGESATKIALVPEQGNVNRTYDIETHNGSFIVRVRFDREEIHQFLREKRCAELIRTSHDWTPEIIAIGICEGNSYSVQHKVYGTVASQYHGDMNEIWEQVGRYAQFFHGIKTPGYLYDCFRENSAPEQLWCQWYFDYLGKAENSRLISRGLLSQREFEAALEALSPLKVMKFEPTLAHGNLSPNNIVVDSKGKAHVIDWGTCQGHMGTELDLSELLAFDTPQDHVRAYLRGHGLPADFAEQHQGLLERLRLARCLTSAHWLCEGESQRETSLLRYVERVQAGLRRLDEKAFP